MTYEMTRRVEPTYRILIEDRLVPYSGAQPPRSRAEAAPSDWDNAIVLTPQAIEGLRRLCKDARQQDGRNHRRV